MHEVTATSPELVVPWMVESSAVPDRGHVSGLGCCRPVQTSDLFPVSLTWSSLSYQE